RDFGHYAATADGDQTPDVGLVRRFVLGEAYVAKDAKQLGLVQIAMSIRAVDASAHFGEELLHRRLPPFFELGLVRLEPSAVLVLRELLKKLGVGIGKTQKRHASSVTSVPRSEQRRDQARQVVERSPHQSCTRWPEAALTEACAKPRA